MNIPQVLRFKAVLPSAIVRRTGPHDVGTIQTRFRVAGNRNGYRSLVVQLWYPANGSPTMSSRLLTWYWRLRHPTWAPARRGAPWLYSRSKFPLIAYVPDAPGDRQDNTYTLANLASHGFILAAIQNPFALANRLGESTMLGGIADPAPDLRDRRIKSGVLAASALLDALEALRPGPVAAWSNRLDLKRAAILGYALGGTVAVASTIADRRYTVAASLDGAEIAGQLVRVPYLHMGSDPSLQTPPWPDTKAATASSGLQLASASSRSQASMPTSHIIEVAGTHREQFSDRLVLSSLLARGQKQSISMRVRAIIDAYTVAFFKTYLQAAPHPLMCVRHSPYPEVRFIESNDAGLDFPPEGTRRIRKSDTH